MEKDEARRRAADENVSLMDEEETPDEVRMMVRLDVKLVTPEVEILKHWCATVGGNREVGGSGTATPVQCESMII